MPGRRLQGIEDKGATTRFRVADRPARRSRMTAAADFGKTYWRKAARVEAALAPLDPTSIDDASFRLLADNVPTLCWMANGDGYIVWYNRRWYDYTGTTPQQMEGWGWTAVHDPERLPDVMVRWQDAIAAGEPFEMTFPLRGADGVFRPFLTRIGPVRDATGTVARWCGVNTKIADQIAAENALREERDRAQAVLDGMGEGFIILDRHYTIEEINREGLRIDGRPREAVVGHHLLAVWPEAAALPTWPLYQDAFASGEPRFLEYQHRSDQHDVWLEVRAYPIGERLAVFYRDVTARRRAEDALREREERLRLVIEGAADHAIMTVDCDRRVTSWSTGARAAFGWTADDMLGESSDILFTPEDRDARQPEREVATALRDGVAPDVRWHQRKDGSPVFLNGSMRPLHDAQGNQIGFLKVARDETERHRVDGALRDSEARLRALAEASSDVLYQMSPDWGEMHELDGGDFLASTSGPSRAWLMNYIPPEDHAVVMEAIDTAITNKAVFELEHRVRRADGTLGWTLSRAVPILDGGGQIAEWFGAASDVTARREAEQRLRELNRTLEERVAATIAERDRAWNNARDLLAVLDTHGVFRAVNPAWEALLGWSERELVGRPVFDFIDPDTLPTTEAALTTAAAGPLPVVENRYRHKDGSIRHFSWVAAPEGDMIYATGRDITAEKERQAELERTQEQLRQAQKMEAVGQLTGGIAHDFNNLLTGVIGSLDMMQRRIARGELDRIERYATTAMTSANRAAALTHRLLAFSRRQPLDPKPVNANRLITGMEELLRRTIGEAIRLEIVTAGGLWQTLCDPHQLESAVLNLAINARDAMPDGGRLTIETCNAHLDNAYAAQQREVTPGQYVCICVTDTGGGMSADVMAKAFEPFFTTKPIGQGTGLGLSMIYGFARQSEGYGKIYSELGHGTTIKLYLPRYYGEADEAEAQAAELTDAHRSETGEVVLVVEDETAVRDLVVDVLGELGYRAIEAVDGPSGLKLLQSDLRVDLLVTDVGLPGLNGRQLADAARAHRAELKVLFMTGYAENATIANGFLDPRMAMITKPFAIEALATRIRDMIEQD